MSRSRILPALSSSRQMMIAWKVSGASQRPAIIVSRPASMRLAMAISPSRREQLDRAHLAQIHADRIVGAVGRLARRLGGDRGRRRLRRARRPPAPPRRGLVRLLGLVGLDDVDAHVGEHGVDVLDLLGGHFAVGEDAVQFVDGDIAALLGGLDHLLDGGIGKVEQRSVCGLDAAASGASSFSWTLVAIIFSERADAPGSRRPPRADDSSLVPPLAACPAAGRLPFLETYRPSLKPRLTAS